MILIFSLRIASFRRLLLITLIIYAVPNPLLAQLAEISQFSSGADHACVVLTTGRIVCWGNNTQGQLGTNTTADSATPIDVIGISFGGSAVSAGDRYTCAVSTYGGAKCWGSNLTFQLGDGTDADRHVPVDVLGLTSGVASISASHWHTCAILTNGALKCWGNNGFNQIGDGTTTTRTTPTDVSGLTSGVSAIALGYYHTCALSTAGGIKCWGYNNGQLGVGDNSNRSIPTDVIGLTYGVEQISAGYDHTCALTTSGGVKCWGSGLYGQLGDGIPFSTSNVAVDVVGLSSGASSIAISYNQSCAVTTTGGMKCWGSNSSGQLGDGTYASSNIPVDVAGLNSGVNSASLGYYFSCAQLSNATAKCWGANEYGQLGDGTTMLRYSPDTVSGLSAGAVVLVAGDSHTCVITTVGAAKCWGDNGSGRLGDGSSTARNQPTDVVGLTSGIANIDAGDSHTCAVTTNGGAKCWGNNTSGKLGDATTLPRMTAIDVVGLATGVASIATGQHHSCAVTTAGGAKCWGRNSDGQLGDATSIARSTPVDVFGLTSGVISLALGNSHTCALTTGGSAQCWGSNNYGQLGNSTFDSNNFPVNVSNLTNGVAAIAAGYYHTCAVLTGSGIKCWGSNFNGRLGDGSTSHRSAPVDVVGISSGATYIAAGNTHTCVVTTVGGVKCWGSNNYGNLGDGTKSTRYTPVDVTNVSTSVSQVALGNMHTCAVSVMGEATCWGSGAIGDSNPEIRMVMRSMSAQGVITVSGLPLTGVALQASNMGASFMIQDAISDGAGSYLIPLVEMAPYTITPTLAGYSFTPPSITGTMAADVTQDFVATLITYNITGTVTASGNPLAGATVDGGAIGTQTTDSNGQYSYTGILPATAYTLSVSHAGATFGTSSASGTLNSHATHDFSGTLTSHSITGTITHSSSGLAGVTVDAEALGTATTDSNGDYSFTGVNYNTSYTITPSLTDYTFTPGSRSGTLTGDTTLDFSASYNPPSTTSTSSGLTTSTSSGLTTSTSSVSTTSLATTTTVETSTTTGPVTSTAITTSSPTSSTTSIGDTTTTVSSTSLPVTTTASLTTTVSATTTSATSTSIPAATTTSPKDTDDDGVTDSEEEAVGTNPKDPGSKAPKLRTTICSDWNGYLGGSTGRGMYNIMEHINLTAKKVRVKTELRSIRGHLKDTYEFFLRGNQQFDLLVHDMGGREVNSYGQVCTTYERAPAGSLDGRMVYYKYDDDGDIQFAFALPFENPTRGSSALSFNTAQPSLDPQDSGNLVANWVQLSNVSKKRLKGKLTFYSLAGTPIGNYSVNLRDGARYDYSGHAWGSQAGLAHFVPEDKTVDYQLRAIRYLYDNPNGADSFTSAYPFNAGVGNGEMLIAPVDTKETSDAASGATTGETTSAVLELSNTLGKKVSVSVKLYDTTGKKLLYSKTQSLKAYSTLHLPLDTLLPKSTGLLTAKSSHAGSIIGSIVHYGRTSSGGVRNLYAAPLREPVGTTLKGSYNTYLNQGCTLYIANSAEAKEKVTIALRQNDGTSPVKNYSLTVPSRGLLAEDVCAKSPQNVYGVVTMTVAKSKRITALLVREGERSRYKMATELR